MSIRKLLANSDNEFWQWFVLPSILGIIPVIMSLPAWFMGSLPLVWKIIGALVHAGFAILYLCVSAFLITMASPYGRPCFFRPGDVVTRALSRNPYLVVESRGDFAWAIRVGMAGERVLVDGDWRFYECSRFERLLQKKLERLIANGRSLKGTIYG